MSHSKLSESEDKDMETVKHKKLSGKILRHLRGPPLEINSIEEQ